MRGVVLTVVAVLLAACGGAVGDDPGASGAASTDGDLLARCSELVEATPPPGSFADSPVYVGNEQPTEEVRAWASQRPGFQELWIDRDNNGWVVVGFTEQVDEARAEAAELFGDDGVAVAEVERSLDDLLALQEQLHERAPAVQASSANVRTGHVEAQVAVLTEQLHAELTEEFAGEPVCVDGGDPADAPPTTQPADGDGWRLLAAEQGAPFEQAPDGVATTPEQLAALATAGRVGAPEDVDLASEVVVLWTESHGSSCPERVFVDVDVEGDVVRAVTANPEGLVACTADLAGAWSFLVAVERSVLPAGPFTLADDRGDEAARVTVDLSRPGAVLDDGDLAPPSEPDGRQRSGAIIETGFPAEYAFDLTCSAEVLGVVNDVTWVATAEDLGPGGVPQAWRDVAEDDGTVTLEVLVETGDPPRLTATAGGQAVTYEPGDRAPC